MSVRSECRRIYTAAFGETAYFDDLLFNSCFEYCEYIKSDKKIAAMLFLLPCQIAIGENIFDAKYLYAAATASEFRGRGIMTELLKRVIDTNNDIIFLKPATDSLVDFYLKRGFEAITGVINENCINKVILSEKFSALASFCDKEVKNYTLMYNKSEIKLDKLYFADTMG